MHHIDPVRAVAKADGRYHLEAYTFLYDALDTTIELVGIDPTKKADKHVSGQQLLEGMRVHALRSFGPLAAQVWRQWGVRRTEDWGRIVFNLVEGGLLRRQDSDSIEDFIDGYDFEEAFVRSYEPTLPAELDAIPRTPLAGPKGKGKGEVEGHGPGD